MAQCDDRYRRRSERRIKAAGFPLREGIAHLRVRREPRHRPKYVLAAKFVHELVEASEEKLLTKTIARYRVRGRSSLY
jgi:hypothetical protein